MKYLFTILICFGFFSISSTFGQEETKKVIVVKKIVDENGQTTTQREEASGAEADALIKKLKEDGSLEGVDIDIEIENAKKSGSTSKSVTEDITVEKTIEDGKEITTYKIETEENGEKKVMIWKSEDGDMPEEMAKKLEHIDIKSERSKDGKEVMIMIDAEHDEDNEIHETHTVEKRIRIKKSSDNKVSLGVMIEDDGEGVVVSEVVQESAAQKAGLKEGDTILKVNGQYVFNTEMLLKVLSKFDKGDKIKVTYLRDGKELGTNAQF